MLLVVAGVRHKGNVPTLLLDSQTCEVPTLAPAASAGSIRLSTFTGGPAALLNSCESPGEGPGSQRNEEKLEKNGRSGCEMGLFNGLSCGGEGKIFPDLAD